MLWSDGGLPENESPQKPTGIRKTKHTKKLFPWLVDGGERRGPGRPVGWGGIKQEI